MELITLPRPIRIIWGSIGAWWLAHVLNPGFNPIAIMLLLLIPILVKELYFTQQEQTTNNAADESTEENSAQENSA